MRAKYEKIFIFRIDFETADGDDYGFELIEAHDVDEAITIFRDYYEKDEYLITDVLKRIGKESGTNVWAAR